jgi:hypothetical protein
MPPWEKEILDLWKLYDEAESYIAEISSLWDGLDVTVVNQLRYAGRHLLNALTGKTHIASDEEYSRAVAHVKRATFDALSCVAYAAGESLRGANHLSVLRPCANRYRIRDDERPTPMKVLHAFWLPDATDATDAFVQGGSFRLWAETLERRSARRGKGVPPHPFQLLASGWPAFLEVLGAKFSPSQIRDALHSCMIHLPSAG